ncbi:MAG: thermonuclease family protein [Vampirovibrionales bacterium]
MRFFWWGSVIWATVLLTACYPNQPAVFASRVPCTVYFVMDGDTFSCDLNNNGRIEKPEEHIRLLGVDAPETRHSAKARRRQQAQQAVDEPMAQQAKAWLQHHIQQKTVWLLWDVKQHDPYGRSLAWLYTSSQAQEPLNVKMVREGMAAALFLGPNRLFEAETHQAETEAFEAQRGIWSSKP